ncbi:MAG: hypothetical protein MJA27_33555 [Pseudanabaenales cyanobacterium]|nr:hypothetical protein [Pseudanabaenales cyanobacterium]
MQEIFIRIIHSYKTVNTALFACRHRQTRYGLGQLAVEAIHFDCSELGDKEATHANERMRAIAANHW